jgi:hypothetical protein
MPWLGLPDFGEAFPMLIFGAVTQRESIVVFVALNSSAIASSFVGMVIQQLPARLSRWQRISNCITTAKRLKAP